ncbi:MAG: DUF3131 domain-containing protein [Candidatus Omnitrophica bacterium]|nr:DUF3131 domain-containing protein [Candidatus Omnitrophota bacterium]
MSQARLFIGRVEREGWSTFQGEALITVEDFSGKEAQAIIRPIATSEEWLDIEIPTRSFREVDFNRLKKFSLILKAPRVPVQGILIFDEFAFFGPVDLYFESARDNLKEFPTQESRSNRDQLNQTTDSRKFLRLVAEDVWKYFEQTVDQKTGLVFDHIRLGKVKGIGDYTSPTNIAFYWLACIAASDLGFITHDEAAEKIGKSLETVRKLERWQKGFYYNFYHTGTLQVTRRYVSSVDNGWLVASLVVLRQAFPGQFDKQVQQIIQGINFSEFYDSSNGQLKLGFDEDQGSFSPFHYGLLVSEARLMSYVAIGKGDLPKEHWARIYRTLPRSWDWQTQVPQGAKQTLFGIPVFEGYYVCDVCDGQKIVPSWGGSLFEFLAPTLLIDESRLARKGLGRNNLAAAEAHIEYARKKGYPVWGIAPAAVLNGKQWSYREFGVKEIAAKGYPEEGVIAPYASILALEVKPEEVVQNLRKMIALYPSIYGPYGFYDSVDVSRNRVNIQYLALDHGMTLVAIANYLESGSIRKRFHQDLIGKWGEELLREEQFFE